MSDRYFVVKHITKGYVFNGDYVADVNDAELNNSFESAKKDITEAGEYVVEVLVQPRILVEVDCE